MRLDLIKSARGIVPATAQDAERLRAVRVGDLLPVTITKPRNGKHHRKFWALVQLIQDNHPRLTTQADVLVELKIGAGHYSEHITNHGEIIYVPRSIGYEDMDQLDFAAFYKACLETVAERILPGIPAHRLDAFVREMAGFD